MTRRQLLPPKPSVRPSVIFFVPHHDGAADAFAAAVVFARRRRHGDERDDAAGAQTRETLHVVVVVIVRVLPFVSMIVRAAAGPSDSDCVRWARRSPADAPEASSERSPVDRVERHADRERRRLDELSRGVASRRARARTGRAADRKSAAIDRRDEVAATAEQRGAAEHHGRDGRQKVVVALVRRRLVDDAGEQHAPRGSTAAAPRRTRQRLMALHPETRRPAAIAFAPTPSKRRPTGVSLTTAVTTSRRDDGEVHGIGMPSQSPPPSLARRAVVVRGMPPEYQNTAPYSSAFVPSVATIGLRRMRPIRNPLSRPAAIAARNAMPIAGSEPRVLAVRVVGDDHDVERHAAGDREVDAALHDDERLAEGRDREHRGERQHRQQHASAHARRREARGSSTKQPERWPRAPS